ncbi:sporulation protein [Pullulanibacillus sp. KACC 23026]|uniref:sporulation protein n=1 Tax=Pullulanibacillus sp. KACC 23026 TaxID=3028315 RepID=UPI0023AFCDE8|nr:sporulation protein [Pullulanibacillus sp. KACC 23026]WEG11777.1 sporulation protein [Pullulanibacillus sp. KACC 23026]
MKDDHTLDYVLESLSNWVDTHHKAKALYEKLMHHSYKNEEDFARALSAEEAHFLSDVLSEEINYAEQAGDKVRLGQLNDMYEQLY